MVARRTSRSFMGQCQVRDGAAAGGPFAAFDQVPQRHGLAPEGMDHLPVAHDVAVALAGPHASAMSGVAPRNSARGSSWTHR